MSQYSLSVDGNTNLNNALLVREAGGAVRPAQRAEILAVARDLVTLDELRGEDLSSPDKVTAFLRLRLAGLEHEVFGADIARLPVSPNHLPGAVLRHFEPGGGLSPRNPQAGASP
ncbi:hypothetical protein [Bordetella trematum]|uniref:hypothetical protein n=1 Tax=Bordetella trematum TaxID=123899 RepID=UPI000B0BDEF8|nr:hypothetical protein [Bordetella trematum]